MRAHLSARGTSLLNAAESLAVLDAQISAQRQLNDPTQSPRLVRLLEQRHFFIVETLRGFGERIEIP